MKKITYLFVCLIAIQQVFGYASTLDIYTNEGLRIYSYYTDNWIKINTSDITGTRISCHNISDAAYDVCAGDGGGAGGGSTYNYENFTANLDLVESNNISYSNGELWFNMTCEQITGSADLCDGSDASAGSYDPSVLDSVNQSMLDNGTIIRTGNISGWDRSLSDDFNLANYSTEYASSGYDNENWTATYTSVGWDGENQSAREAAYFNLGNTTGWDMSVADEYNKANFTIENSTITAAIVLRQIEAIAFKNGNFSAQLATEGWKLANFTAAFEAEVPLCGAGEYLTADGSDLSCDTPTGGGGGAGDKWLDIGTKLMPNSTFANNVFINGSLEANDWSNTSDYLHSQGYDINLADDWTKANFTVENDTITASIILRQIEENAFKNGNFSGKYAIEGWKLANDTAALVIYNTSLVAYISLVNTSMKAYVDEQVSGDTSATDDFNLANYSTEYASSGYDNENWTSSYASVGWDGENQSAREAAYFNLGNTTGWDMSVADDYNKANFTNENSTITAAIVLRQIEAIAFKNANFSARLAVEGWKVANQTSREGAYFNLANYSSEYATSGWKVANQSAREVSYFSIANNASAWDMNVADDYSTANNLTGSSPILNNVTTTSSNQTFGNFSIIQINGSCVGFRFGSTGGRVLSCG